MDPKTDAVATPTDVTAEGEPAAAAAPAAEEKQPARSNREDMLDLIDQQVEDARQRELAEAGIVPEAPAQPAAQPEPTATVPEKVRVKVYGEEREVPLDEMVAGYQKILAADQLLAQAATAKKANDIEAARLRQLNDQLQQQLRAPLPPAGDTDEALKSVVEAIVDGDTESAVTALKSVIGQGRPVATPQPTVDVTALTQEVASNLSAQQAERDFFTNNPDFSGRFDQATGIDTRTPQRKMGDYLFDTKYSAMIDAGQISYQQALNDCAAEVRQVFPQTAKPAETPPSKVSDRESRKAALDTLPLAGGGVRPPTVAEEKEESFDDIITEMRRSRNLA